MNKTVQELPFMTRDVLNYLRNLKRLGHRGVTSKELIFAFYGIISEQSVFKQLRRLKSSGFIKEVKIVYASREVIFYEAV